ncbi:MAG: hypothetical protein RJA09_337 [Pseudomonadota bacterium]
MNAMNLPEHSPLGQASAYPDRYDASLLFPLPRLPGRTALGLGAALPFTGADLWTAFEVSWLNPRGKPQVAIAHVTVPCETPNLVESKSFKLYLNGYNQTVFDSVQAVQDRLRADLSEAVWRGHPTGGTVGVQVLTPDRMALEVVQPLDGLSLDRLDVDCTHQHPDPGLLVADTTQTAVEEVLVSDLLKSNCPVTGQPDWASVRIAYTGHPIDQAGLLRYIVGFRTHNGFHEQCVEQVFTDIWNRCKPSRLSVYARYTRRGGLDINPWRTSHPQRLPVNTRTPRQ